MTNSDKNRERENLTPAELHRAEMRKALWRAEELEAAVQIAQETQEKLKAKSRGKTEKGG